MRRFITLIIFFVSFNIHAIEADLYLGMTPITLIESIGSPSMVLPVRGGIKEEDDVLFFYRDYRYFYFNGNRVWQVRYDRDYKGEILGLKIGSTREDVILALGEPVKEDENSIFYRRPDRGYPLFVRLFFNGERVEDVYIYRGDY